jgi:hypothetical protein
LRAFRIKLAIKFVVETASINIIQNEAFLYEPENFEAVLMARFHYYCVSTEE